MEYEDYNFKEFITEIRKMADLSKAKKMIPKNEGFIYRNKVTLFSKEYLENHTIDNTIKIINISHEDYLNIKNEYHITSKLDFIGVINQFDCNYFDTKGKKKKNIRNVYNLYTKKIKLEIFDRPKNVSDFENFINNWKMLNKDKYRFLFTSNDLFFFNNILSKYSSSLQAKFFYDKNDLIGYTIIEKINDTTYNYLFGKAITKYKKLGYFIDHYSIKNIFESTGKTILVNFDISAKNSTLIDNKKQGFNVFGTYRYYMLTLEQKKEKITQILKIKNKGIQMNNLNINIDVFKTNAYKASLISKNFEVLGNIDGYIKNDKEVILYSPNEINKYKQKEVLRLHHITKEEKRRISVDFNIENSSTSHSVISKFDSSYFVLNGKKNKEKRNVLNKYGKNISLKIQTLPNDLKEVNQFLKQWSSLKEYRMNYTGKDLNFIAHYLPIYKENLITRFFYDGEKLVGFIIIEKITDSTYNLLIRKADPKYSQLTFFIDFTSFREIHNNLQADFFINLGIDGGEKGIREYKTNKFPNNTIIPLYNVKLSDKVTIVQNEVSSNAIKSATECTPIEKYNNIHFKRDDLYKPYSGEFSELGGSKLRQMQMLLDSLMNEGKFAYNGIITYSQTTSIQTLIVAKIAQEYGIKCTIGIGVKSENLQQSIANNKLLKLSQSLGAEIVSLAKIAYNSVLRHFAINYAKENNLLLINFGINTTENSYAVISGITCQVKNLPEYIDNLIVPCGSGITLAGIIVGCHLFNIKVKRFIGIQISGYDRTKEINKILKRFDITPNYKLYIDKTYKYSKKVNATVASSIELNKVYEAKAYEYFIKNKERIEIKETEKTIFWIVANNNKFFK